MICYSTFSQQGTHLKFSSCSASNCCCSWLCFLPEGVLGSSNVSSWLALSVRTSFSANKLFRSSWRTATCPGTVKLVAPSQMMQLSVEGNSIKTLSSQRGEYVMLSLSLVNYFMQSSSHFWAKRHTPSITENSLPLPAVKANSTVNPCWKQGKDKVHFKQTC